MPRTDNYAPKHRSAPAEPAFKKGVRKALILSGVAVAATGLAVSTGIVTDDDALANAAASLSASTATDIAQTAARDDADRSEQASRSARRTAVTQLKKKHLDQDSGGQVTRTEDLSTQDPRDIGRALLPEFGFSDSEFGCLDALYVSESDWDIHADNPTSSAYGIPQSLPGEKMASAGADWAENPVTQIRWGLGYIAASYGTPCSAWSFKQANNWY